MHVTGGMSLATSNVCPKCGFSNRPDYQFCTNCGNILTSGAPQAGVPPPVAPAPTYPAPPYGYGVSVWEAERRKQIDRTKTGVLLLLIGSLLGWVPLIGIVGSILILIGAILVILGRKPFGPVHSRNVFISVGLFVFGIVGAIVLAMMLVAAMFSAMPPFGTANPNARAAIESAFNNLLIGVVIISAISSLASVFFTYAIQNTTGRVLLWLGYGMGMVVQIVIFAIVGPVVSSAVEEAFATGIYNPAPLEALQLRMQTLGLMGAIPSLLYAGAYYLVWSRINRGEIPAPPSQPPTPAPVYFSPPPLGPM